MIKVKPLHITLPKANTFVKVYDRQIKGMYFLIEDDDLLEKCNTLWDKVSADIKKNRITSLSIKIKLKTKIKSHVDEVKNFHNKKTLKWILIILV